MELHRHAAHWSMRCGVASCGGGGLREGMGASTAALCDTHYAQGMPGRGKELGHTHIDASDSSNLVAFPRRHVPEGASTLSA